MFFVAEKSAFTYFWLHVALARFGCAQEANNGQTRSFNISTCGEDQFECQNQECIRNELLCDGRGDCSDLSDETEFECTKPELNCPDYAFRCNYGACVDRGVICDGIIDCITDGSDEDRLGVCYPINMPGGYGGYAPQPSPIDRRRPCYAPFSPINGHIKLRRLSSDGNLEYVNLPSLGLEIDSLLIYVCDPGYKLRGDSNVRCLRSGRWTRRPVCVEIRCRPIGSVSTLGNCTHASGQVKPCSNSTSVYPKTRAEVWCRPGYKKDVELSTTQNEIVECNDAGKWVPEPIRCVPVCGIMNLREESFDIEVNTTNHVPFPWHANIYMQRNVPNGTEKIFRCGATIIQTNLLLTAARCIYDFNESSDISAQTSEAPDNFFVTTANIQIDYDSPMQDSQFISRHRLRNVHTNCNFRPISSGNHFGDIALIELEDSLEFTSTLLPICLDKTGINQRIHEDGANGRVIGLERSSTDDSSRLVRTTTVPYIPHSQCISLYKASQNTTQFSPDQFCTGYNNETDSCANEVVKDGGGLVHEQSSLWYLTGVVTQGVSVNTGSGGESCVGNSYLLHTNVSQHMTWIQQVVSDLERLKYPPCSRYLPPFQTKNPKPPLGSVSSTTTTMTTTTTTETITTLPGIIDSTPTTESFVIVRDPFYTARSSCIVPEQPANGKWRLHRDFCDGKIDCFIPESDLISLTRLAQGSQLVFSCDAAYRVEGRDDVYCRADGNWSAIPVCTEIKCGPLVSRSTVAICERFGESVDCNFPMSPGTEAKVSCRSGYWTQMPQSEPITCNLNGTWESVQSACVPVCGSASRSATLYAGSQIPTKFYNFPWHASIYIQTTSSKKTPKEIRCGGTLIQSNLVLTAAHCIYNGKTRTTEDPKKLFILMNNVHRQYASILHDPHSVRKGLVKNVHIHCKYRGQENDYVSDIALLELQERFEFFNIQLHPACLDFSGYNEQVLGPGASGAVIGFGKTITGAPNDILQTLIVPYVSQAQCKNSNITLKKEILLNSDKFCAGYGNGTTVRLGEGGGGLFVLINDLWHVMGIASVELSGDTISGENGYVLYTKTSDYTAWILDVMFHLERYKSYPPCSRSPITAS